MNGRYYIVDQATGRKFCIEPIAARNEKIDGKVYVNGGTDGSAEKNKSNPQAGALYEEDSIITPDNGYSTSITLPAGMSPNDYVEMLCRTGKKIGDA